jgi:hypothetical protein
MCKTKDTNEYHLDPEGVYGKAEEFFRVLENQLSEERR